MPRDGAKSRDLPFTFSAVALLARQPANSTTAEKVNRKIAGFFAPSGDAGHRCHSTYLPVSRQRRHIQRAWIFSISPRLHRTLVVPTRNSRAPSG